MVLKQNLAVTPFVNSFGCAKKKLPFKVKRQCRMFEFEYVILAEQILSVKKSLLQPLTYS